MGVLEILIAVFTSICLSILSNFIVLRRYSLIADAFSHIALPGIALSLIFSIDIFWGSLAFLILGALFIYLIEKKTSFYLEAIVGFIFLLSLAIGKIFIKDQELIESLFGNIKGISLNDFILSTLILFFILISILRFKKELILVTLSEDLAANYKIKKHTIDLFLLFMVALAVSLGIKIVGVLLVGSYLIICPLFSSLFAKSFNQLILFSIFFGFLTSILGLIFSINLNFEFGPVLVIVQSLIFLLGFFIKNLL